MQTLKIFSRIVTLTLAVTLIAGCSKETKKTRLLAEADHYFQAGDYDKAKVSYLNVVQLDPQNALAFERIGEMWLDDWAPVRASAFLAKASELNPNSVQNRVRLARSYAATGRLDDARKEALKVLEQSPDNADALVTLTEAARSKEGIEAAEEQLQKFPKKTDVSFYLASANLLFNTGDIAGAGNALRQALAADPKSSQAHMAMGNLYLLQRDKKQAGEELKRAAELAPIRSMERLKYAAFTSATGDTEETRRIATEMTRQAPDYLPGWTLLAELALKDKKYDEALSLLENVSSRDPEYIDGRRLESEVLLAKGDTKKAVDVLERLDQTYPDSPLIKYQLASAYLRNNSPNQAKLALEQAISINPNYDDAILRLAEINLRSGHAETVIEPITNLLRNRPNLRSAAFLLAAAYGSLDRFDDAEAVIRNQVRLAPEDPQPHTALGLIFRQAKRNDEARQAFEKAAELAPDNLWLVDQLVELDLVDKHFDSARERIHRYFRKTPELPAAHCLEGKVLIAEGKWDLAAAELKKTLQLDPNFSTAYDLLVQTYIATNKLSEAASQLQAEISKDPKNTSALLMLALLHERMENFPHARDAYEKVLSVNPNFVLALNNLAYLDAERLNDLDRAYELARRARDLQWDNPAIADTLGWVLSKRGDYQQALTILQDSAEKLPDNPEIQFHLGMTAYAMGQTDIAKIAFKKAAAAPKDFPGKDESKRRLSLLENGTIASPELSVSMLEAMTKEHPNDPVSQMLLGEAYEKPGASDKAAAAFEQAVKLNPKLVSGVIKLAQLYAGPLRNKEKALAYAKKARELAPGDPQIAALLGKIAYDSGNFAWSYNLLQEAARLRQNDPALLSDLAWSAYSLGRVNEARDAMQKVLTNNPDPTHAADAQKFLALTALSENPKDLMAAQAEIHKELQSNPEFVPALMAQAALDTEQGQVKRATEAYDNTLRRWPEFALAQKRLAALYAQDPSTLAAAYDLAAKARKTLSDDAELTELLGRLSYEKKEYPRAVQLLQESARQRPLDVDSLFYLGMSQLQARQTDEARGALNQALAGGLEEPLATEAKRALADAQKE
jgi:tetratricopeptide (TPR) repeat protein